jgi:hypothetical protein
MKTLSLSLAILTAAAPLARAEEEIDVKASEFLDVVETADGSIWKGVLVEQTPNVQYKLVTADGSLHVIKAADITKISRQKNKEFHHVSTASSDGEVRDSGDGADLTKHYEQGGGLPAPYATSGIRLDPSFAVVIPTGDISQTNVSFAPTVQGGYEFLFGNFGLEGGGLARWTYWQLPGMTNDAASTIETMGYVKAALHMSRVALHVGVAAGLDMNYVYSSQVMMSKTTTGLGVNLQSGIEVAATKNLALRAGFDYHPGTDTIVDGLPASISYYGILFGAGVRL